MLSVFALGGINEIGKNMYVLEYGDDLLVIDCGSKFPDESLLGVDLIIQDISYLQENRDRIRALLVTHGHEDHIGGIPYLLKQLNMPVYATRLTLGLIELKLKEHGLLRDTERVLVDNESTFEFGEITVSFFKTSHSIPDCLGIVFQTPEGTVVHTGDFKFDLTPVGGDYADLHKMAEIGKNGVLLLLSESTNAERPGFSLSERIVGEHIEEAFRKADQKIFISTFASNVHRLQQIIDAAIKTNRKIGLLGRSMVNVFSVAEELGYLKIPEGMLIDANQINGMDPEQVVVICTGSQGEPMAALSRLSTGTYRQASILPGDTVIFASSPIPGNEKSVSRIVDNLYLLGAKVIYGSGSASGMHVSGHGFQEELKLMLTLMKPKYFIPIHGEYRMLQQHRILAESIGVEEENIFIINNGDVVDIAQSVARQTRSVQAGHVFVDGMGIGEVGKIILRDRKLLAEEGMLLIIMTISKSDGKLIMKPDTVSRGFIYEREAEDLFRELNELVVTIVEKTETEQLSKGRKNDLKHNIRRSVEKLLFARTKKRPMILPFIIEI
ncbi:ribonuclease J [Sporosarcina thermotolerans]|uniref:Ribonuclease J n=2 Tax=Sporosarcina thermotolerans TaxID=633404 RepID=A0AAW9A8M2_9BACL|nr:ribonuclease J [Sporosarcina thermotolerans]MDW0116685.1 ribonuclease J [Sporosarcina thermotolerans]WHT49856.1 ribonuclease J [Sporosarcina thermotolerans]